MIHLLSSQLREERDRALSNLPAADRKDSPSTMSLEEVLDAHFAIADFFDRDEYGMGGVGIKNVDGFVSTVGRQEALIQYGDVANDPFLVISTLVFGIIRNHPFYDANKRTAFLCALTQIHKMGRTITASEREFEDLMVEVANRNIERRADFKKIQKKGSPNPETLFISNYLRKNSRKNAKLRRTLKWRDLKDILRRNGFEVTSPYKGTIDIIKKETTKVPRFFFGDKIVEKDVKVCNVAFHGDGQDVPDNTLKYVRQMCGLTEQDGFDGDVIFRNAQPTFQLISSYRGALQRLSYR